MEETELNPGELLKISGSYWEACTPHAAVKLEVFTALADGELTAKEVAEKLQADERGTAMLLNAVSAMGLLTKSGDRYSNTSQSKALLSKDSPRYIGHMIMHHHHLVLSWSQLDEAVRTGSPVRGRPSETTDEKRESFLMGMFNLAMGIAPGLAKTLPLDGRRHLLDLGGGPGTYAIHFCLENPELKATVYDLHTTRPFAEKTIDRFGLSDRVSFMEGNYLDDAIDGTYDAVWLSHILHAEGPEDCRVVLEKAAAATEPGGLVMIHEFILNNAMDAPLFPALFSLNMLCGTSSGQSYSEEQLMGMLEEVGVGEIQRVPFRGPNNSGIIAGVVGWPRLGR